VLTLESGPARLVVAAEKGGRVLSFSIDGLDLLVTPEIDDHNFGCFQMAAWVGRVRHGSFDFEGQRYQLPLNNPPHAIHGTARDQPWQEEGAGVISAALGPPWPFGGRAVQRFELTPDALHLTMEVHAAEESMPVSCGWHPWWNRNVGGVGRVLHRARRPTGRLALARRDHRLARDVLPVRRRVRRARARHLRRAAVRPAGRLQPRPHRGSAGRTARGHRDVVVEARGRVRHA
jgi:galactose mutarotase-like enzyme